MHSDKHGIISPSSIVLPALTTYQNIQLLGWEMETSNDLLPRPVSQDEMKPLKKTSNCKPQMFICTEVHCGKQFPRSFALRRHMRIHTGTKPYECDYAGCMQRFNTSGNLSRHKRIHSGERPYPCLFNSCGKRFNTSTKLKRHMRLHFPDGKNVFRCIGRINCNWSCDNYKEFAQHQKLYHHILVGAQQQEQLDTRQDEHEHGHGIPTIEGSTEKDTEYFSTVDTTRNYSMDCLSYGNDHVAASNFLYPSSFDKSKSSVLPVRNKRTMGPSVFLGSTDLSSCLPTGILSKDHGPDKRRMRPSITAFPPVQYANSGSSLLNCSDSGVNRATFTTSNHFAPFRRQERRDDSSYEQYSSQQHQTLPFSSHHVLHPPPQRNDDVKYNGFTVATPEFTGEELSVVLQLMNETY